MLATLGSKSTREDGGAPPADSSVARHGLIHLVIVLVRFDDPIVEGNRVAYAFTVSATQQGEFMGMPSSGRRCTFDGVSLVRVNDEGLITEERRRYDFTGLLTQLGVFRVKLAK